MEPPRPARLALLVHLRPVIRLARPRRLASLARCCVLMVLGQSIRARVRLGPAYGGIDGVNDSPPHTLTMRGVWTSAAPPIQALKTLRS